MAPTLLDNKVILDSKTAGGEEIRILTDRAKAPPIPLRMLNHPPLVPRDEVVEKEIRAELLKTDGLKDIERKARNEEYLETIPLKIVPTVDGSEWKIPGDPIPNDPLPPPIFATEILDKSDAPTILDVVKARTTGLSLVSSLENQTTIQQDIDAFRKQAEQVPSGKVITPVINNPIEEFNPLSVTKKTEDDIISPEQIITSADISVFYVAEVPVVEDMSNPNICSTAWRKELIVLELDSVMSIGYSTIRERYPVRSMGHSNPRSHTKGPRTIAGHIAFAIFVNDVLDRLRGQIEKKMKTYQDSLAKAKKDSSAKLKKPVKPARHQIFYDSNIPSATMNSLIIKSGLGGASKMPPLSLMKDMAGTSGFYPRTSEWNDFVRHRVDVVGDPRGYAYYNKLEMDALQADIRADAEYDRAMKSYEEQSKIANVRDAYYNDLESKFDAISPLYRNALGKSQLLDSLPAFHLLVMGTNEAGHFSKFMIKDVVIVDENQHQGVQQPNIINKVQFIAQDMVPMSSFDYKHGESTSSLGSIEENYGNGSYSIKNNMNEFRASDLMSSISKTVDYDNKLADQTWLQNKVV